MIALSSRRARFLGGLPYMFLIFLLSFLTGIEAPPAGSAQEHKPAAPGAIRASGRPKPERGDIARFGGRVQAAIASGNDKAYWGLMISDADSGEVLYSLNAGRYFMPASNVKLFTTAMALATLGSDFHIRTTVESAGQPDSSGHLESDLVLVGRGDANLSNRSLPFVDHAEHNGPPEKALAELADQVVASGVREISGDIIADDSYFAPERYPPGWGIDDAVWSYGAAVSALAINDNFISVDLRPVCRVRRIRSLCPIRCGLETSGVHGSCRRAIHRRVYALSLRRRAVPA